MAETTLESIADEAIATVIDANGSRWRIENWDADDRSAYLGGEWTLPNPHAEEVAAWLSSLPPVDLAADNAE